MDDLVFGLEFYLFQSSFQSFRVESQNVENIRFAKAMLGDKLRRTYLCQPYIYPECASSAEGVHEPLSS